MTGRQPIMVDRNKLLSDLKYHVVEVLFTKLNGKSRTMKCTLMQKYLPPNYDPDYLKEQHEKVENKQTIVAWDVEQNAWRSFRIESVQYCQVMQGYE